MVCWVTTILPDRAATTPHRIEHFSSAVSDQVAMVLPKLNSTASKEEGYIPEEEKKKASSSRSKC
jgi:hypothetical protein